MLCLGVAAMRTTLKENWQDKLICECTEVKSVKKCPNYVKKGRFPPSFPRFYHHQIETNTTTKKNVCCGFTSSDLKKRWWQKKGIPAAKELCLWERRPFENNRCCHVMPSRGNMGELPLRIRSAKAYSMAHPAVTKASRKKPEDLTFDDYKLKSSVLFEWQDVVGIVASDGGVLSVEETHDVLTDFRKRFSGYNFSSEGGDFALSCKEDLSQLDAVSSENRCTLPERGRGTCCCPEIGMFFAGKHVCLKVNGAEEKQRLVQRAIKEKILFRWPDHVTGWKFDFGDTAIAANAPNMVEVTDPESRGKIRYKKRSNQIESKNCVGWTTKQIGMPGQKRDKKYCTEIEVKLKCPAGHARYETVPGSELTNREYACKAGLKNSVSGDPDFASKCKCR